MHELLQSILYRGKTADRLTSSVRLLNKICIAEYHYGQCAYWQLNITCSSIFCRFRCCSTSTSFPAVFSIKVSEPGITHEGMRLSNSDFLFIKKFHSRLGEFMYFKFRLPYASPLTWNLCTEQTNDSEKYQGTIPKSFSLLFIYVPFIILKANAHWHHSREMFM